VEKRSVRGEIMTDGRWGDSDRVPPSERRRSGDSGRYPLVVVYEDRTSNLVGVKLLLLSLQRFNPELTVEVAVPGAPESFLTWIESFPRVAVSDFDPGVRGWDVKPHLLLRHLRRGVKSVCWIDSDIILCGDLLGRLEREPPEALVATEDLWWSLGHGRKERTAAWGLAAGVAPETIVNTGVVRVGPCHIPVLEQWADLLSSLSYRAAQQTAWSHRPWHLLGDQDALTALLGSRDFTHLRYSLLKRGADIVQCFDSGSFSPAERYAAVTSRGAGPVLLHAMGGKPWDGFSSLRAGRRMALTRPFGEAHRQLSPYTREAARYVAELPGELDWTAMAGWPAVLSKLLPNPLLKELPLALVSSVRHLHEKVKVEAGLFD
jgi:hypothetical protein